MTDHNKSSASATHGRVYLEPIEEAPAEAWELLEDLAEETTNPPGEETPHVTERSAFCCLFPLFRP
jgi:hypothetical protein